MVWNVLGTFTSSRRIKMSGKMDSSATTEVKCVKTTFDFLDSDFAQHDLRKRPRRMHQVVSTAKDVRRRLAPCCKGLEALVFLLVALLDLGTTWANCTAYSMSLYKSVVIEQCMYVVCSLASCIFVWEVLFFCKTLHSLCRKRHRVKRQQSLQERRRRPGSEKAEVDGDNRLQEEEEGEGERKLSVEDEVAALEYQAMDVLLKRFTVSFFEVLLHDLFMSVLNTTRCQLTETGPVLLVSAMTTLTCVCVRLFYNICLSIFLRYKYKERRFKSYQPSTCIKGWMLLAMTGVLVYSAVSISRLMTVRNPAILLSDTVLVQHPVTDSHYYRPLYYEMKAEVDSATSRRLTTLSDVRQHGEAMIFTVPCVGLSHSRLYHGNRSHSLQDVSVSCRNNCTLILQVRYEKVAPDSPTYLYNAWRRTNCGNQVFYTGYNRNGTSLEHLGDVTSPGFTVHIQGSVCNPSVRDPDMALLPGN